jgi:preprotein translocase subunit YajC
MNLLHVLLFAQQGGAEGQQSNPYSMFIFIGLMIFVLYFFMIRPQRKKDKEARMFRESLGKGEKIVTIGGMHGKIVEVQETTFTVETESGARMRIEKSAVSHTAKE